MALQNFLSLSKCSSAGLMYYQCSYGVLIMKAKIGVHLIRCKPQTALNDRLRDLLTRMFRNCGATYESPGSDFAEGTSAS